MIRKLLLWGAAVVIAAQVSAQGLIPTPRHYTAREGELILDSRCVIVTPTPTLQPIADYLTEYLPLEQGRPNVLAPNIWLEVDPSLPEEGYRLEVGALHVRIEGGAYRGVFYGVQTLLQLLPSEVYAKQLALPCEVPCCSIEDQPAYAYRGFLIDVARTWLPKERILREIDHAAHHKLNTLHWHLTDDEGWRIEIRSHPELTTVGAFRGGCSPIEPVYGRWDEYYGGYYTQEEIREVVAYAQQRGVEVIPEIDLPGHSRAFARVHPEILCQPAPDLTRSAGYDLRNVWCVAREENYRLLEEILNEVCALFPSPYIHIGGDEVDMDHWEACPRCQNLIKRLNLPGVYDLHRYFALRMISILKSNNKKPIVWHEATFGGFLGKECMVQAWDQIRESEKSLQEGYSTVVMPAQYFYFDMRQSEHEEGHSWADIFDIEQTYRFSPDLLEVTPEERSRIAGFECTFFSEIHLKNSPEEPDYLDYMLYPRLLAVAENSWHDGERNWPQFKERIVKHHYDRMAAMGIRYRLFPPAVKWTQGVLSTEVEDQSTLYYTKYPEQEEILYTRPIQTEQPALYQFRSRYQTGRSPLTAHPSFYQQSRPEVRFTTSMPISKKTSAERIEQYRLFVRLTRTHRVGDWVEFRFAVPLTCREVEIQTGYFHLPRLHIRRGYVEVSYDGERWEQVGELAGGCYTLRPQKPLRAIRLVATETGNGEEYVLVQPLQIKK